MRTTMRSLALLGLAAALLIPSSTPAVPAQEAEELSAEESTALRVARGRTSYRLYCRNCHGKEAKGDGPIAELLKVQPADLTALTEKAGGEYPADSVYRTIDGRNDVRGHGNREMPVWGFSFRDPSRMEDQEEEVRERIFDLVEFLESLQRQAR